MPDKRRLVTSKVCFGSEKAGLLDYSYNKCALVCKNLVSDSHCFCWNRKKNIFRFPSQTFCSLLSVNLFPTPTFKGRRANCIFQQNKVSFYQESFILIGYWWILNKRFQYWKRKSRHPILLYKALESWILRPFSGWRYCFHGHFWEIRDSLKRDNRHSD